MEGLVTGAEGFRRSLVLGRNPTGGIAHVAACSIWNSTWKEFFSSVGTVSHFHVVKGIWRAWTERIAKQEP